VTRGIPLTHLRSHLWIAVCIAATAWLAACTQAPTPYGPLAGSGGYQESRLQERMYRVTFQGNPATRMGAVLDMALLRGAELAHILLHCKCMILECDG